MSRYRLAIYGFTTRFTACPALQLDRGRFNPNTGVVSFYSTADSDVFSRFAGVAHRMRYDLPDFAIRAVRAKGETLMTIRRC